MRETSCLRAFSLGVSTGPSPAAALPRLAAGSLLALAEPLVIVESPAKAKTINKYLGNEYVVKSSIGHIRDLLLAREDLVLGFPAMIGIDTHARDQLLARFLFRCEHRTFDPSPGMPRLSKKVAHSGRTRACLDLFLT